MSLRPSQPLSPGENTKANKTRRAALALCALFAVSLPLINPWIRGDGVGYYALARALLIEGRFDFTQDYIHANERFREARLDEADRPLPLFRTPTGHLDNHFSVGPAILWAPFLLAAHGGVLAARAMGSPVKPDGFSAPYRFAMAFATALYGFLALLISFRLACCYVHWKWAFLATLGVWGASSLAIYMYFNPSWSHAHAAFAVAAFVMYWHKTRGERSLMEWVFLGALAGLMLNVYYANATLLAVLGMEAGAEYLKRWRAASQRFPSMLRLCGNHVAFLVAAVVCLLPTFVTRSILYGSPFSSGYTPLKEWFWTRPALWPVLSSSNHGLFFWTPLLLLAVAGLVVFAFRRPGVGGPLLAGALAFYLLIACYPDWDGISSYGNRFFVSLTPLFVLGLAVLLHELTPRVPSRAGVALSGATVGLFILWNVGLMFQWGMHLVPARGPVPWVRLVRNQFFTVPGQLGQSVSRYFFHRSSLMKSIEARDIDESKEKGVAKP